LSIEQNISLTITFTFIVKISLFIKFTHYFINKKLDEFSRKIIDKKKWDIREEEMKNNINKNMPSNCTIVIITGCGHIPFFKKNFPNAEFSLGH